VAHGFPQPDNLAVARAMVDAVAESGAIPAVIAVVDGVPCAGLTDAQLRHLATSGRFDKCASRDVPRAIATGACAATTVSATCLIAAKAGIEVFATGGIGGVHRDAATTFDISADLGALARWPVLVVSAGAKSILDLPATVERLETLGVPVVGFDCDQFPAFYARESGVELTWSTNDVAEIARAFDAQKQLGGMLVANPVPADSGIDSATMKTWIDNALRRASTAGVHGRDLTPFLLQALVGISGGQTLRANRALAVANARLAAQIAANLCENRQFSGPAT